MLRSLPVLVAALSILLIAGCPPCDPWDDPNTPANENAPANSNEPDNSNAPDDPAPLTTTGTFAGEITGTFQRQIDGVAQEAQSQAVRVWIEFDQGRLVSIRPFGPSGWWFGWVEGAAVTEVGDVDDTQMFTNTSHLSETVTLSSYDVDEQRILLTVSVEFSSRRGGNAEVINGTSTQTFELRPDGANLNLVLTGDFDFSLVTQNPANPGLTTQNAQQFSGSGTLTPATP
ncbi:MAG: hypothetical protein AMXMBFR47_35130 [Planctomycetota bacterium]